MPSNPLSLRAGTRCLILDDPPIGLDRVVRRRGTSSTWPLTLGRLLGSPEPDRDRSPLTPPSAKHRSASYQARHTPDRRTHLAAVRSFRTGVGTPDPPSLVSDQVPHGATPLPGDSA